MTDNIKLPELPAGFRNHNLSGHDEAVFTDLQMAEYARAAVLADRERMKDEMDALRADADRYRWLASNRCDVYMCVAGIENITTGDECLGVEVDISPNQYPSEYGLAKPHLDREIDAARAAGGEK